MSRIFSFFGKFLFLSFFHSSLLSSKICRPFFPIRLPCFLLTSSPWPLTVYCRFSFIHFFPFRILDLLFVLTFIFSAAVCVLAFFFYLHFSLLLRMICWWNIFLYLWFYAQDPFVCSVVCPLWFRGPCRYCSLCMVVRLSIPNCTGPHVCLYYFVVPVLLLWFLFSFSNRDYFSLLAIGPATNSVVISVVLCACELYLHFIIFSHVLILCSLFPFILPLLWLLLLA